MEQPKSILAQLPLVTLLLSGAAIAAWCVPGMALLLQYDRPALSAGQMWRIFTCHFAHFSVNHLLWDVAAFALLGALCERRGRAKLCICLVIAAAMVPAAIWIFLPQMQTYRGLSGISSALFTGLAIDLLRAQSRTAGSATLAAGIGLALFLFVIKIVVEMISGRAVFVDTAAVNVVPVPLAHFAGASAGLLWAVELRVRPKLTI